MQTERDRARVMDGLRGVCEKKGWSVGELEKLLSSLEPRTFLMNNIHEDEPCVLHSRWALSFLRGPLTGIEIGKLMEGKNKVHKSTPTETKKERQNLPVDVDMLFWPEEGESLFPHVYCESELHFKDRF